MSRILAILALLIVAASAFVAPSSNAVTSPAFVRTSSSAKMMMPMEVATEVSSTIITQNANLIATNAVDFGGYFFPVTGLVLLATLILYLSPPLAQE